MKPQHPKAIHYRRLGLFHDLAHFNELESRISQLETPQERGDAFEVFAEAYFSTVRKAQASEVYPWGCVPADLRRKLRVKPEQDKGIDGVFTADTGKLVTYQVKFRGGRKPLHWGGNDGLSTFFGLTERADQRVVFTNSNRLPEDVLEGRANSHSVRGHHLDKLTKEDFRSIQEWLETGIVEFEKWKPRPHQEKAIAATCEAFKTLDRATLVMACGTGKTLVALWAAERQKAKNILVLVPSLALIGQTLEEWTKHNNWDEFSFLCVCSDKTVARGADALAVQTQELDFPVTTDAREVRKYLQAPAGGTKVIFSTYQSAKVVAEGMRKKDCFDLGIFDEAHKTAGHIGKTFGFALEDENIRIDKRLFMTATPRHYSVTQRDKEGDAKLLFSMDVPEVYGPVVHTLSFAEAARQGIICDYKIVISVVTSDDVSREMLRRGEVLVDGDEIKAHWVANQVALQKALEETGAHRVLTFHTTIREAKAFTSETGEGIGYHAPDYKALHISGAMPTAKRENCRYVIPYGTV